MRESYANHIPNSQPVTSISLPDTPYEISLISVAEAELSVNSGGNSEGLQESWGEAGDFRIMKTLLRDVNDGEFCNNRGLG